MPYGKLFDTVLVVEDYPKTLSSGEPGGLAVVDVRGSVASTYPLTVLIRPGEQIEIELFSRPKDAHLAERVALALGSSLSVLANATDVSVGQLRGQVKIADTLVALRAESSESPIDRERHGGVPQGAIETKLASLLKTVLGVEVGRDDDFFEVGGTSIAAASLFNAIEARFGKRLPLGTLFRAPTLRLLAQHITDGAAVTDFEFMRTICDASGLGPLICIHGQGGEIIYFRDLAVSLDDNRPCYGFEAKGLDGSPPHQTVEEMETAYLGELAHVYESGPHKRDLGMRWQSHRVRDSPSLEGNSGIGRVPRVSGPGMAAPRRLD